MTCSTLLDGKENLDSVWMMPRPLRAAQRLQARLPVL